MSISGDIELVSPPFSVEERVFESDDFARMIPEAVGLVLPSGLSVDISASGRVDEVIELTPSTIPAGTRVSSYLLHADLESNSISSPFVGSIVFGTPILGIIVTEDNLQASHAVVGDPLVVYPTDGSNDAQRAALEIGTNLSSDIGDTVQLDLLTNTLTVDPLDPRPFSSLSGLTGYDHLRIITAATNIPEPSALCLAALTGLLPLARRR